MRSTLLTVSKASILLVEDEVGIAESVRYLLERDFFEVAHVTTLLAARAQLSGVSLVVLDLGLPDGDGADLLRELRAGSSAIPVIVLTSRSDEVDRIVGLELGADDYVTKPFSARELVARIKAVLRRSQARAAEPVPESGLVIDAERRRVTFAGVEVVLTMVEFDLLKFLVDGRGRVFTREALLDGLWPDATVADRTVDAHIKSLRKNLRTAGGDPELIETVRGVGYRARE